ncbi:hypothetical protein NQD34_012126 [Periophthalmus magnuspinnatus]|nr:hypothetical protein NQD34_012126 [Periophthalmus magnuspinnatus]
MKASFSNQKATRTEPLTGKKHRSSQIPSLPKTKKKVSGLASKMSPILKRQTCTESLQQDGKQDYNTNSDLERRPIFTEIWPSSEPSSPSDMPSSDKNVPTSIYKSSENDTEHSSVLAKYVDRFRHGEPQSREERQQKSSNSKELLPFWWAASLSLPSNLTPEKTDHRLPHHNRAISQSRGSLSVLSDTSQCEPYNSEILQLQERASRLLQKGEFTLEEDSLPVSSDGVGCSDFSSPVSADEPVRKPLIPNMPKYNIAKDPFSIMPSSINPLRPEEDILFQWRLRRKMEKARERMQSQQHFDSQGWQGYNKSLSLHSDQCIMGIKETLPPGLPQGTSGPHLTTLDQQTRIANTTATTMPTTTVPSSSIVSSPQALAHVPSHMHLLCDILPCPNQSSNPHEEEMVSQKLNSQTIVLPQKTQNLPLEPLITVSVEKDVHLSQSESTEALKKQPEKSEEKSSIISKEQKKLARVHLQQKIPSNITSTQKHTNSKKSRDGAPSPIQSALGQVVSEVLFPSMDSTLVQEIPPASPPCLVSKRQHSDSESVGIISQFLQEAEDSDEKEFEDDPLLQVLRKQRKWVKEQINEVDTLLKEFQEQNKI